MIKGPIITAIIPNRTVGVNFGISTILSGGFYFFYAKQITHLLPRLMSHSIYWAYLIGLAYFAAGVAILFDLVITKLAAYLLALLLFCLAVAIDLRGLFNFPDELKIIFAENLIKDIGLIAGAI